MTKELFGEEFTVRQLRLLPYLQYLAVNRNHLDPTKINEEERAIVSDWRQKGYIDGGMSQPVTMTKEFWDKLNEVMWLAYIDIDD